MFDLDDVEVRVLGCLLEKQRTTPDQYPLTLNALRLACNQATNRDPVVEYDEPTIQAALQKLHRRELTRVASGHTSRTSKYRHLLVDTLDLKPDELALLGVLLLRGDQTPGELKTRSERLHHFDDLAAIDETLSRLVDRRLAVSLERRRGEKQIRYRQTLADDPVAGPHESSPSIDDQLAQTRPVPADGDGDRLSELEAEVGRLRRDVAELNARIENM